MMFPIVYGTLVSLVYHGNVLLTRFIHSLFSSEHRYFDFRCLEELPAVGSDWYKICGTSAVASGWTGEAEARYVFYW